MTIIFYYRIVITMIRCNFLQSLKHSTKGVQRHLNLSIFILLSLRRTCKPGRHKHKPFKNHFKPFTIQAQTQGKYGVSSPPKFNVAFYIQLLYPTFVVWHLSLRFRHSTFLVHGPEQAWLIRDLHYTTEEIFEGFSQIPCTSAGSFGTMPGLILREYWTGNRAFWLVDFSYWPSDCLGRVLNDLYKRLAEAVRNYPVLYDKASPDFKDRSKKDS